MSARPLRLICLSACLLFATSVLAQEGHPVKGSWVGDWGPSPTQRNHIVLVMDWDGKNITGSINPGPNAIPIKLARLDVVPGNKETKPPTDPTFKVHIEADSKDAKGNAVKIVADGTIQETALPNRSIAGTWSQTTGATAEKGEFKIRRQ
jgi:hypothetical protein